MPFFNPWASRPPLPGKYPGAHEKEGAQDAWIILTADLADIYETYRDYNDKCVNARIKATSLALISFLTAVTTSAASTLFVGAEHSQIATQIAAFLTAVSVSAKGASRLTRTPPYEKAATELYGVLEDARRDWISQLKTRDPKDLANAIMLRSLAKSREIRGMVTSVSEPKEPPT